jgi:hypothetical protein
MPDETEEAFTIVDHRPDPSDGQAGIPDAIGQAPADSGGSSNGEDGMAISLEYWQERLYKGTDLYDTDAKFFENSLKSAHIEGKMGARELSFSKGGGLPTVLPLPSQMGVNTGNA